MSLRHTLTLVFSAVALTLFVALLYVRAQIPGYPNAWTPYAKSRLHDRLELIVDGTPAPLEYRDQDDCLAAAAAEVQKPADPAGLYRPATTPAGYAPPYGCHYSGYANPILQRVASLLLKPHRFRCIAKLDTPPNDPQQYLYFPSLPGLPDGDEGYCVP